MAIDDLIRLLNRVLKLDFRSDDGKVITFTSSDVYLKDKTYTITQDVVDDMLSYDDVLLEDPIRIQSKKYCEFLLKDSSKMLSRFVETNVYPDKDNQLTYTIGKQSLRMTIALLKYADEGHEGLAQEMRWRFRRISARYENDARGLMTEASTSRSRSLQISLDEENSNDKIDYLKYCTSFCFVSCYNLGRVILPINTIDDLVDTPTSRRKRRSTPEEMEPPHRKYINELVHFYARGNSGDSWDYQYLSYYHVLEYFFEKVYSDSVVSKMRMELTRPEFSLKREKDLLVFANSMRKIFKDLNSSSGMNEEDALQLVLTKYVPDLERLRDNLNDASTKIVDYLKTTESPFSASKIDFEAKEQIGVYTSLTHRIYATRNAIAHSKESISKKKFVPFKHDKALINEVLLMRIIAEEVIINSSKEM